MTLAVKTVLEAQFARQLAMRGVRGAAALRIEQEEVEHDEIACAGDHLEHRVKSLVTRADGLRDARATLVAGDDIARPRAQFDHPRQEIQRLD